MPLSDSCLCLASLCDLYGIGIMYMVRVMYVREMREVAQRVLSLNRFFAQQVPGRKPVTSQDPPSHRECVMNLPVCPERGGSSLLLLRDVGWCACRVRCCLHRWSSADRIMSRGWIFCGFIGAWLWSLLEQWFLLSVVLVLYLCAVAYAVQLMQMLFFWWGL